jgi:hypothetical protein
VRFSLIGFRQGTGFRVFTFGGTATDHTRTAYAVRAHLALTRKHGIRVQELPLRCQGLLSAPSEGEQKYTLTFTEERTSLHAEGRNVAVPKRKSSRKPLTGQAGSETWSHVLCTLPSLPVD